MDARTRLTTVYFPGFKSGLDARKAARSAGVRTLARCWRLTFGVGGAKVWVFAPALAPGFEIGGFIGGSAGWGAATVGSPAREQDAGEVLTPESRHGQAD